MVTTYVNWGTVVSLVIALLIVAALIWFIGRYLPLIINLIVIVIIAGALLWWLSANPVVITARVDAPTTTQQSTTGQTPSGTPAPNTGNCSPGTVDAATAVFGNPGGTISPLGANRWHIVGATREIKIPAGTRVDYDPGNSRLNGDFTVTNTGATSASATIGAGGATLSIIPETWAPQNATINFSCV